MAGKHHLNVFPLLIFFLLVITGCARILVVTEKEKLEILPKEIPEAVRPLFGQAEESWKDSQLDKAFNLYTEVLLNIPSGKTASWAHLRRGQILIAWEKYSEAAREFREVPQQFKEDPLYLESQYYLGLAYSKLNKLRESDAALSKVLESDISPERTGEIEAIMGDNLYEQKNYYNAFQMYLQACQKPLPESLLDQIRTYIETIIHQKLSLKELEQIRQLHQTTYPAGDILYALGNGYYQTRNFDKAQEALTLFIQNYPDHPLYAQGNKLYQRLMAMEGVNRYSIGCILPLTGKYAVYGNKMLDAVILGSNIFNSSEDYHPIKLTIADSQGDPEIAEHAVDRLVKEEGVMAIIGTLGNAAAAKAAEKAQELGVPLLSLTAKEDITEKGDFIFQNFTTASLQVKSLVNYVIHTLGLNRFAILFPNDTYGIEIMNLFWDEVLQQGGEIRGAESYRIGQTDFGQEIKALSGTKYQEGQKSSSKNLNFQPVVDFDALFIPDSAAAVAMIAPQLSFYDVMGIQLIGPSSWRSSPEFLQKEGEYLEGAVFADEFYAQNPDPVVIEFVDRYYSIYGREPDHLEALAYDAAAIVAAAIQREGVVIREDVKDLLLRMPPYHGITGTATFSEKGKADKKPRLLTIKERKLQPVADKEQVSDVTDNK